MAILIFGCTALRSSSSCRNSGIVNFQNSNATRLMIRVVKPLPRQSWWNTLVGQKMKPLPIWTSPCTTVQRISITKRDIEISRNCEISHLCQNCSSFVCNPVYYSRKGYSGNLVIFSLCGKCHFAHYTKGNFREFANRLLSNILNLDYSLWKVRTDARDNCKSRGHESQQTISLWCNRSSLR